MSRESERARATSWEQNPEAAGTMELMTGDQREDRLTQTQLVNAIDAGDVETVKRLLDEGCNPNPAGVMSPLGHAASSGQTELVQVLIDRGADVAWRHPLSGWSAVTLADASENWSAADLLEAAGASKELRRAHGYTPLHRAALRGDVEQCLDARGIADVNAVDSSGESPLALSVRARHEDAARLLLRAGANPNAVSDGSSVLGEGAYQDSIFGQNTDFVGLLLAASADPNPSAYPPLFNGVNPEGSSVAVFQKLAAAGADVAAIDAFDGGTVLHRVAWYAGPELVGEAVRCGAEIEALDNAGLTPLLVAASRASVEIFARLAAFGANRDATDRWGNSVRDLLEESGEASEAATIRRLLWEAEHQVDFDWNSWRDVAE